MTDDDLPFDGSPLPPWPRTPLARAKAAIRGCGWTVSGNRARGYEVSQLGAMRTMTEQQLLDFGGQEEKA